MCPVCSAVSCHTPARSSAGHGPAHVVHHQLQIKTFTLVLLLHGQESNGRLSVPCFKISQYHRYIILLKTF